MRHLHGGRCALINPQPVSCVEKYNLGTKPRINMEVGQKNPNLLRWYQRPSVVSGIPLLIGNGILMLILELNDMTYLDDPVIEQMVVAHSCFFVSMVLSLEARHMHSERKWNNEHAGETPGLWVLTFFGNLVSLLALLCWFVTLYWIFLL